jgi:hypothetical protein
LMNYLRDASQPCYILQIFPSFEQSFGNVSCRIFQPNDISACVNAAVCLACNARPERNYRACFILLHRRTSFPTSGSSNGVYPLPPLMVILHILEAVLRPIPQTYETILYLILKADHIPQISQPSLHLRLDRPACSFLKRLLFTQSRCYNK